MPSKMSTHTGSSRSLRFARLAIAPLLGLAFISLAVEVFLVELGPDSSNVMVRDAFVTTVAFAAAVATLLAAVTRPAGMRAPWFALGLGVLSYASAFLVFFFFQKALTIFPSPADFFWLASYPLLAATIVLLVRRQRRSDRLGISLDAAIVALAVGALGYKLIFNGLIDVGRASDVVGGQLSYSVLDFAILVMLVLACAPSRSKVGKAYLALGAGMFVLMVGDIFVVRRISEGTYVPGTLLDASWPAGLLLLAIAANLGTTLQSVSALRGRTLYAAIVISFTVAFALLIDQATGDHSLIVVVLAGTVLFLVVVRLVASVRENERLARDNEGIISAAGEGIFRNDLKGRVTYANPAALEMLGYSLTEVLGRRAHELFHHTRPNGTPYPASECPAGRSLAEGATHRVTDELFWRKDGSSLAVDYTARRSAREAGWSARSRSSTTSPTSAR